MPSIRERLAGWMDSFLCEPSRDGNTRTQYIIYDYAYVGGLLRYLDKLEKEFEKQEAQDHAVNS